eukprot:jgi/Botrbrau1/10471/Bobra.0133s0077.1
MGEGFRAANLLLQMETERPFSTSLRSFSEDEFGYVSGDNGSFGRRSSDESDTALPRGPSMNLAQARAIINNYGRQLQKCIKNVGVDPTNPHEGERLGQLVEGLTDFIRQVDSSHGTNMASWSDQDFDVFYTTSPQWSSLLEDLDLAPHQVCTLSSLYCSSTTCLRDIGRSSRNALAGMNLAWSVSSACRRSVTDLYRVVKQQRAVMTKLTAELEGVNGQIAGVWEQVFNAVLTPLQAARVLVACKPNPPDVLALLEEVHVHFVEGCFTVSPPSPPIAGRDMRTSQSHPDLHDGFQPARGPVASEGGRRGRSLASRCIPGGGQRPHANHNVQTGLDSRVDLHGIGHLRSVGSSPNLVGSGKWLIGELEGNRARFY